MRNALHWLWSIIEVVIIVYVVLVTSFILCRNKYGYTQFGDYTFSNVDLIGERNIQNTKKGDLLIVKNTNDINNGDLIYYYAVFNDSYIIRSSVVTNVQRDDYTSLYTVGEEGLTVASTRVLGKYSNTYSSIGGILNVLESKIGFLFLVLLPIMVVFIYQIYEFAIIIRYDRVEEVKEEKPKTKKSLTNKKEIKKEEKVETKEKPKKVEEILDDDVI